MPAILLCGTEHKGQKWARDGWLFAKADVLFSGGTGIGQWCRRWVTGRYRAWSVLSCSRYRSPPGRNFSRRVPKTQPESRPKTARTETVFTYCSQRQILHSAKAREQKLIRNVTGITGRATALLRRTGTRDQRWGPIPGVDSVCGAPHRFQVEYPELVPSAQFTCVTPTKELLPLSPWYFPVPPV